MNTKRTLPFISIIVALTYSLLNLSCSNDDNNFNNNNIKSYHGFYTLHESNLIHNPFGGDNLVKIKYDNQNRIVKRIGDIIHISQNAGGGGYLHDSIYTDLSYSSNKIFLEKKFYPFNGLSYIVDKKDTITVDANNRMIEKISYREFNTTPIDTTAYTYNGDKLTKYITTSLYTDGSSFYSRGIKTSNLYYSNNNLDSIVTINTSKTNWDTEPTLSSKTTHHFSGYDQANNPFKSLQIFEDCFFRSLSENNFTEYKQTSNSYYYPNGDFTQEPIMSETQVDLYKTWDLMYDEQGDWIYDQF